MYITRVVSVIIFLSAILVTGCVTSKSYFVDPNQVNRNFIFTSPQSPSFSIKLSEDFKYLEGVNLSKNDTGLSYTYYNHYFANEKDSFFVSIQMITLNTGEWHVYRPWKWDLGKEIHGDKPFYCGTSYYRLKMTEKEKELSREYKLYDGTLITTKVWVYTPGGISGGTRIIIRYFEKGNHTENMAAFIKRANNRLDFQIGKRQIVNKTKSSVADELIKLKELKEQGVLTKKEFEKQKEKLLSQ